jgi:hypothetical protein
VAWPIDTLDEAEMTSGFVGHGDPTPRAFGVMRAADVTISIRPKVCSSPTTATPSDSASTPQYATKRGEKLRFALRPGHLHFFDPASQAAI